MMMLTELRAARKTVLNIRIDEDFQALIKREAQESGLSVSSWVRTTLLKQVRAGKPDSRRPAKAT